MNKPPEDTRWIINLGEKFWDKPKLPILQMRKWGLGMCVHMVEMLDSC